MAKAGEFYPTNCTRLIDKLSIYMSIYFCYYSGNLTSSTQAALA